MSNLSSNHSIWLDVLCSRLEREQSLQMAADELGVPVEMLLRWVVRIAMRKTRKGIDR